MTNPIGESEILTTAEIEAFKRRQRILELKRKLQGKSESHYDEPKELLDEPPVKLKPVTENDDSNSSGSDEESETLISSRTNILSTETDEPDLSKLASRKVDWDLKKSIEKSLAILQERTDEIIAEIVQESMGSDEESED